MAASAKNSFYKAGITHSKEVELMLSKCASFLALFYFDLVRNSSIYGNSDPLKMGCIHLLSQIKCAMLEDKCLGSLKEKTDKQLFCLLRTLFLCHPEIELCGSF